MADYSETVDLDRDALNRFVRASAGWGRYLESQADKALQAEGPSDFSGPPPPPESDPAAQARRLEFNRLLHSAASSYVIAGGYAGVSAPAVAELLFWAASSEYLRIEGSRLYGGVLAACTNDEILIERWLEKVRNEDLGPRDNLCALILLCSRIPERSERDLALGRQLLDKSRGWRGAHLTDLFVPASLFIDTISPLFGLSSWHSAFGPSPYLMLLNAYADQFEFARAPRASWKSFSSRFLPVSPELLATALAVETASRRQMYPGGVPESSAMAPVARMIVDVAREIRDIVPYAAMPEISRVIADLFIRRRTRPL